MVLTKARYRPRVVAAVLVTAAIAAGSGVAAGSSGVTPVAAEAPASTARVMPAVSSTGATGAAGGHVMPVKLGLTPPVQPVVSAPVAFDTCPTVRAHLKQHAASGGKVAICVTSIPAAVPSHTPAPARAGAQAVPAASSTCPAPGGQWLVRTRFDECTEQGWIFTAVDESAQRKPIGQATFLVDEDMILQASSDLFVENERITYSKATGFFTMLDPRVPGELQFFPSCSAPCQVASVPGEFPMTPGEVESFPVTFDLPTPGGTSITTNVSYAMTFTIPDAISDNVARWSNPAPVRCDSQAPGAAAVGCVFPGFTPTLVLPASVYGTAAVNVAVGETFLPGNPGYLTPLHRGNPADRQGNMDGICDNTFFRNSILVPNDSCDEYPFASSLESGGQRGQTGANCLEAIPQIVNGVWQVWFLNDPVGQLCERGHVPNALNTAVGGPLSLLYGANRMLIGDAYFVQATP